MGLSTSPRDRSKPVRRPVPRSRWSVDPVTGSSAVAMDAPEAIGVLHPALSMIDAGYEGPIRVRAGARDLAIVPWATAEEQEHVRAMVGDIVRFYRTYRQYALTHPEHWAASTPFPWLSSLEPGEIDVFARELFEDVLSAIEQGSTRPVRQLVMLWQQACALLTALAPAPAHAL